MDLLFNGEKRKGEEGGGGGGTTKIILNRKYSIFNRSARVARHTAKVVPLKMAE